MSITFCVFTVLLNDQQGSVSIVLVLTTFLYSRRAKVKVLIFIDIS